MSKISVREMELLIPYIHSISGINLDSSKQYLLESRLKPLLKTFHCSNFTQLYKKAVSREEVKNRMVDAISTNETFFFRDKVPFELLKYKIIPDIVSEKEKRYKSAKIPLRIWSAASSTGQEPYSIAMALHEVLPDLTRFDVRILGTDISNQVIAKATYGLYSQMEIDRGLSRERLQKFFTRQSGGYRVKDEVRILTNFRVLNLLHPEEFSETFDVIFCRNVAIYFKEHEKVKLFKRLKKALNPEGALLLGGSESLTGIAPFFLPRHYLSGMYYKLSGQLKKAPPHPKAQAVKASARKKKRSPFVLMPEKVQSTFIPEKLTSPDKKPEQCPAEEVCEQKTVRPDLCPEEEKPANNFDKKSSLSLHEKLRQGRGGRSNPSLLSGLQKKSREKVMGEDIKELSGTPENSLIDAIKRAKRK